jgi:hypothetical protein
MIFRISVILLLLGRNQLNPGVLKTLKIEKSVLMALFPYLGIYLYLCRLAGLLCELVAGWEPTRLYLGRGGTWQKQKYFRDSATGTMG